MADNKIETICETCLDGVFYGEIRLGGKPFRLGSAIPDWRDKLAAIAPAKPGLAELAAAGIWLGPTDAGQRRPGLAVMCCGLGSGWVGMGRELYLSFPAARAAMEKIASFADWDLLALLDEESLEKINFSRWQIPYLFMLEYAQWSQFQSLGLKPDLFCGHSLGELIALCLADIYDVRGAWQLFETRALHMAELEAKSGKQGGMLAVPADSAEIALIMAQWPDLRVSNRNGAAQYVMSGPRESLLAARKALRKKRIPAVMLNMDLAFHNPAMRVARALSVLRLNGLTMRAARPEHDALSCVTGKPYPKNRAAICEAIADLDENAVDWVNLIENIRASRQIDAFLEIGPQAILCGITSELEPQADFIAADRKGHEARSMREACARLFAAGLLDYDRIRAAAAPRRKDSLAAPAWSPAAEKKANNDGLASIAPQDRDAVLDVVARICGKPREAISLELDLRRDLGLRSSSFPFLVLEAEEILGRSIRLENLFQITTVADLVLFLAGAKAEIKTASRGERSAFLLNRFRLGRYRLDGATLKDAPFSPGQTGFAPRGAIYASIRDCGAASQLLSGLASADARIILPPDAACPDESGWRDWLSEDAAAEGPKTAAVDGIVFAAPALLVGENEPASLEEEIAALPNESAWLIALQRFIVPEGRDWLAQVRAWQADMERLLGGRNFRLIAWLAPPVAIRSLQCGDMLVREIRQGAGRKIVWSGLPGQKGPLYRPTAGDCIFPENISQTSDVFSGICQFSLFSNPALARHGAGAAFSPLSQQRTSSRNCAWLPLGAELFCMYKSAAFGQDWLYCAGFQDLQVAAFPPLLQGITLECRASSRQTQELPLADAMTRVCGARLEAANLTPTGRKDGSWAPVASCSFLFCRGAPFIMAEKPGPAAAIAAAPDALFYETLAFGPEWRILKDIRCLEFENGEKGCQARLRPPDCGDKYETVFRMAEAAMLAAMAAIALPDSFTCAQIALKLARWKFSGIGFCRFERELPDLKNLLLTASPVWRDERLLRFNATITLPGKKPLFVIHNLEFDLAE